MPRRTRILLVEMPRMLCDILADVLSAEPDMEVVGVLSSRGKLRATVAETKADVVVLALEDSELPEDCGRLLHTHPRIRVLGVASDGRRGFLYELRPLKASLGELSPQQLVNTIRTTDRREAKQRARAPHRVLRWTDPHFGG